MSASVSVKVTPTWSYTYRQVVWEWEAVSNTGEYCGGGKATSQEDGTEEARRVAREYLAFLGEKAYSEEIDA